MVIEKVCVRIPTDKKGELLEIAKNWRKANDLARAPGWDAKIIHETARDHFGSLQKLYEHHGWLERGSAMMRFVQKHVKETYGSVENFAASYRSRRSQVQDDSYLVAEWLEQRENILQNIRQLEAGDGSGFVDAGDKLRYGKERFSALIRVEKEKLDQVNLCLEMHERAARKET